jgi:hypothetical protein
MMNSKAQEFSTSPAPLATIVAAVSVLNNIKRRRPLLSSVAVLDRTASSAAAGAGIFTLIFAA